MRKANAFLLLWVVLLWLVLAVSDQRGAFTAAAPSGCASEHATGAVGSAGGIVPISNTGTAPSMLQFKAGGHVLGFQPNKVFLAGLDHALSIEFLGTDGVMPTSAATAAATGNTGKAPPLSTVVYRNLWEGIDLTYESTEGGIAESTYRVAPGADPSKIQLRYNVPVVLQGDGSLGLKFERGTLTESPPVAWQEIGGNRVPVKAEFRVAGNEVGFVVGPYDRSQALIIDPTYEWHTFYGASNSDIVNGIAVDGGGNVYVAGYSPETWGSPLNAHSGNFDVVVLKLDNNGAYQWHTFYGSSSDDQGWDIALDGRGNVYVTGTCNATWGVPLNAHGGSDDIFVLKLDGSGTYQWHAFYGSSSYDGGVGIALDGSGNVYVTGSSYATWGSPLHAHSGGVNSVVLKLDNNGTYQWHTFYGARNADYGMAIGLDGGANVYVAGHSTETWGSPLHAHSGDGKADILVLKLDSNGAYQWHTFYGAYNDRAYYDDEAFGIAVDGSGNLYVTGWSWTTWGSPLHAHSGDIYPDIFVLKLDSNGTYQWHTFYGSNNDYDGSWDIALDGSGDVYVTGMSYATWGSPLHAHSGVADDIFVLKLDSSGTYRWHMFWGSSASDGAQGIALDGSGNIFVAGMSFQTWGTPLNAHSGNYDVVVLKLSQSAPGLPDFNGDGKADILWRHATYGTIHAWFMNGTSVSEEGTLGAVSDSNWTVEGVGDFDGNFRADILWRHATSGIIYAWLMNGTSIAGQGTIGVVPDPGWKIAAVEDFDGNGKADILWHNSSSGEVYAWFMDGMLISGDGPLGVVQDSNWRIEKVVDFDGDARADILWRHAGSGDVYLWLMDGTSIVSQGFVGAVPNPTWRIEAAGDFNGDRRGDILWRHTSSGLVYAWVMNGASIAAQGIVSVVFDLNWQIEETGDFDGDATTDILWRHAIFGTVYLWSMKGGSVSSQGTGTVNVISDLHWQILD